MMVCALQSNHSLFIISLLTHGADSMCGCLGCPLVFAPHLSGQYKQLAYSCNNHRCQSYKLKVLQSKVIQRHCRANDMHSITHSIQNFVFIQMPDAAITPPVQQQPATPQAQKSCSVMPCKPSSSNLEVGPQEHSSLAWHNLASSQFFCGLTCYM